jgi:hypothetical protein
LRNRPILTRGRATAGTYVTSAESPATIDIMVSCGPVANQVTPDARMAAAL